MARPEHITQLRPGDILGGYQLLVAVGAGGMGKVWAARRTDTPTQNIVALKTAIEEMAGDEQFERMLLDEARIAASIVHPNVCAIREVGAERGMPYLVMDWMDAGTLLDLLSASPNRRLDCYHAVRILSDAAAGLHAAHELTGEDGSLLNVVHRDVSPQNVLMSSAGHVKVADFGVAKARGQLHAPTETGEVKGKLSYMAPEQLTSKVFDRRADIFALGCCLYEATTGERPFHGGDALETMYKLLETDCAPPSSIVEGYPMELDAIVLRTLEKDPAKRYQTADDVRIALEGFLARSGRLVTDRDISVLVRTTLATSLEAKSRALAEATQSILEKKAVAQKTGYEITESQHGATGDTARTWNTDPPEQTGARNRRFAVVGLGAAVALGLFVWLKIADTNPSATSNSTNSSTTQAATPAPLVTITLITEPPGASIQIDGGPRLPGPHTIRALPNRQPHWVTVSLDGYDTLTRQYVFDQNQELILGLKQSSPEPATAASNAITKISKPVAPTRPTTTQATPPTGTEPMSTKKKRPKRPIDSSNPFADP